MTLLEYIFPLIDLYNLSKQHKPEVCKYMEWNVFKSVAPGLNSTDTQFEGETYEERVRVLWNNYKQYRFHNVNDRDLEVLEEQIGSEIIPLERDIFLHFQTVNPEIKAFQMALDIEVASILLITNADRQNNTMGQTHVDYDLSSFSKILYYRDLKYCPDDFIAGWKYSFRSSDPYSPRFLYRGGDDTDGALDYMYVIKNKDIKTCHIQVNKKDDFSCDIDVDQMPNFNPQFYKLLAEGVGDGRRLQQSMKCCYSLPSSLMGRKAGHSFKYYASQLEELTDITIPHKGVDKSENGIEISKYMCTHDKSCYILDENSITAHYNKEVKVPLCMDEEYYLYDICILEPLPNETIIGNPLFMGEINRLGKHIRLQLKGCGISMSTKECAFMFSCLHLNSVESLQKRLEIILDKYDITPKVDILTIAHDIVKLREAHYLTNDFALVNSLKYSRRGKRSDSQISRVKFLERYWEKAQNWGLERGIGKKYHSWPLFCALFDCEGMDCSNWRRSMSQAKGK